ncbi:MerR family transcriptional regulator [Clostridium sp. MT-14]|uniref:MerR family transcriptional regulator n=1 Tax=Clostridium aromativorans TaxID=2836848 RepID=A0ABS8N5M8_9CLOT|nr:MULTISPECIES: MerR family transcriptional regulator [Clostridium]KAA8672010.1 MerR family transcriptional regulator [Clostridium sp. HV4-5-A1G]MCC9294365.1 MerR family transcriptional regulator [Clostridium aromativorans]CAB1262377.1 hypothetical protein CLOSBL3_20373 [Clostridiaceae bacterium BL-3]
MKYYVSDVARILGLTPGALHFFESKDIINAKKEDNGYRYYDEEDVFRLLSYFKYHSMGIPLKDIGRHFSGKVPAEIYSQVGRCHACYSSFCFLHRMEK